MLSLVVVQVLIIVATQSATPLSAVSENKVYILALAPFPDSQDPPAFSDGFSLAPGVLLAMEHINQHQDVLPDHTVQVIIGDAGCEQIPKTALSFIPSVTNNNRKPVAVIGPSCSESSLYSASLVSTEHFNITQIAFGTTPELDNHTRYANTFGLITSTRLYANILASLARCNNWDRVSILYEARQYFIDTLKVVEETFKAEKINISYIGNIIVSPLSVPLMTASHQRQGTRIIIVLASGNIARSVSCIASALHFTFPSYQFVYINRKLQDFLGPTESSLHIEENGEVVKYKCTRENINRGIDRAILLRYSLNSTEDITLTASGKTVETVKKEYRKKIKELCTAEKHTDQIPFFDMDEKEFSDRVKEYCLAENNTIQESIFAYPYYDAMWAIALSLHNTLNTSEGVILPNPRILQNQIYKLNFQGVSTYVAFDKTTGHVNNDVDIFQIKSGKMIRISSNNGSVTCHASSIEIINDSFPIQYETLKAYSIATGTTLIIVLTITTVFLHILNIIFRRHHRIKASSPLLNHFIFAGCYATILSMLLKTIDLQTSQNSFLCNFSFYLSNLSYDLIFGTLCAKLWRLYNIFKHTFEKQRLLSNHVLMTYIVIVIVLNGVLHLWMIEYNMQVVVHFTEVIETDNGHVQVASTICQFQSFGYLFIPIMLHILLTSAALVLSILNRNIKFKDFRGSRRIIILAYLLAILWSLVGTPIFIYMMTRDVIYLLYIVASSFTIFLCLILLIFPATFPALVYHGQK